jgi:hypothetical protein
MDAGGVRAGFWHGPPANHPEQDFHVPPRNLGAFPGMGFYRKNPENNRGAITTVSRINLLRRGLKMQYIYRKVRPGRTLPDRRQGPGHPERPRGSGGGSPRRGARSLSRMTGAGRSGDGVSGLRRTGPRRIKCLPRGRRRAGRPAKEPV